MASAGRFSPLGIFYEPYLLYVGLVFDAKAV